MKEVPVAKFMALSGQLPRRTEDYHENSHWIKLRPAYLTDM